MTVADFKEKIKSGEWYTAFLVIAVGFASFGLGRLSLFDAQREPVRIEYNETLLSASAASAPVSSGGAEPEEEAFPPSLVPDSEGAVVASKNSNKYHFPWCPGARRIAEANKLVFSSTKDARAAGYEPAANCRGLR